MSIKLWRTQDIAAYLGVTESAIRNKVNRRSNTIPMPFKLGRINYWNPDDVYDFVKKQKKLGS